MSEKLKPCPFCGGNNLSIEGVTLYWVECIDCNASISGHETEEQAIEAWNSRAEPEIMKLTDMEQRIFLAAMAREEKVCGEADRNYTREPYKDILMSVCKSIKRKVKGALWGT